MSCEKDESDRCHGKDGSDRCHVGKMDLTDVM